MGSRLDLHNELLSFLPNVYFQPPETIQMIYPCIVYSKVEKYEMFSNDKLYTSIQGYHIIVIEHDPDSTVADEINKYFYNCTIEQYYTVNNLNHTTLTLYY